jgi:plasmid stabilization system protein ParE
MPFSSTKVQLPRRGPLPLSLQRYNRLTRFPERGRPSGTPNMRELIVPFGRSNDLIRYVYRAETDEVVIIRIWHGREARG